LRLSQTSVSTFRAARIEWKFKCRRVGNSIVLRPTIALVLGADKNAVKFDEKTILLKRWDRSLFAEGVVILAFEDLLTPQRRMIMTNRAVNLVQDTVNAGEISK
jgi:hypothetical protein